jgi:hypothetical protein
MSTKIVTFVVLLEHFMDRKRASWGFFKKRSERFLCRDSIPLEYAQGSDMQPFQFVAARATIPAQEIHN